MTSTRTRAALLVDDSRLDQLATRRLLLGGHSGFERLEWLDAWPGVDTALASGPFDLYLVDLQLGSASGLEVIRDLRTAGVRAPVIALTGQDSEEVDRACTEAGASDFLIKGRFDEATLERTIRYADRQAAVHRELDRLNTALARRASAENEQAQLLRFAIEQSSDAMLISRVAGDGDPEAADLAQTIVFANAALCRLLGRRAGELLAADVASVVVRIDATEPIDGVDSEPRAGMVDHYRFVDASGPIERPVAATPLRSRDGKITHFVWTARTEATAFRGDDHGRAQRRIDRLTVLIGNLELLEVKLNEHPTAPLVQAATRAARNLVADRRGA